MSVVRHVGRGWKEDLGIECNNAKRKNDISFHNLGFFHGEMLNCKTQQCCDVGEAGALIEWR